jgi:hypothetical protein
MKTAILWTVSIFFLFLAITAFQMHETGICIGMAVVAFGLFYAAPMGKNSKKSKRSRRSDDRDMETAGRW